MRPHSLSGRLATCSYQAFGPEMGAAVRITRGAPRWRLPYQIAGTIPELAPTAHEFGIKDGAEFTAAYQERLSELGVDRITELLKVAVPHARIVLCCFETLGAVAPDVPQTYLCHRRGFAEWWEVQTGDVVPELFGPPPA
ncbi:MAG TPA: hypothetical protein VMW47_13420 [Verrucomicrobiae bacterium]|nr:hypothetical protein [Verrucomicrobiae bacterium]